MESFHDVEGTRAPMSFRKIDLGGSNIGMTKDLSDIFFEITHVDLEDLLLIQFLRVKDSKELFFLLWP